MITRNWGFLINKLGEIMILVTWLVTRFIFKLYRLPENRNYYSSEEVWGERRVK